MSVSTKIQWCDSTCNPTMGGATPFHTEWALDLIRQCRKASVAYFLKQLGTVVFSSKKRLTFDNGHGGDWAEWPKALMVREMPERVRRSPEDTAFAFGCKIELPVVTVGEHVVASGSMDRDTKRRESALKAWRTRRAND